MQVMVAGGAGYIGSHAVKQLIEAGHQRWWWSINLFRGHRQAVHPQAEFYPLHLLDTRALADLLHKHAVDCVMHFAALTTWRIGGRPAGLLTATTTAGTISLLEAMKEAGVKRLVFSSTAATYGEPTATPIVETMRQEPINPTAGRSGSSSGSGATIPPPIQVRFRGPALFQRGRRRADGSLGEDHDPETHLIPVVLQTVLAVARR